MLVGRSAFYVRGADNIALFKNIVCVKYSIPRSVNGFAQDLIKKLLVRNQATRLGNLSRGHLDIMEHAWFQSINFATLTHKEMKAPWIPEVHDPFDVSNFEPARPQREVKSKPFHACSGYCARWSQAAGKSCTSLNSGMWVMVPSSENRRPW